MKNFLKTFLPLLLIFVFSYFAGVGMKEKYNQHFDGSVPSMTVSEKNTDNGWQLKEPTESVEFISGPLVADVGQLCVFRLNDPGTRADWVIVPEATCYVDSSGSSLAFASNVPSKYTIIAAVVEEGVPKILTHICEYGIQPQPDPGPSPNPDPAPKPNPPPNQSLKDWVSQNVPVAGKSKAAALASCYESAATGIESGSIRSQEAAFSVIRTATQTKIDIETWSGFLDALSSKITEKLAGSNDVKALGTVFSEIADGLKAVSDTGDFSEDKSPLSEVFKLPATAPTTNYISPPSVCTNPTGKACQPQPTIQYRRAK